MRPVSAAETRATSRRRLLGVPLALAALSFTACTEPHTVLTQLVKARQLTSELRVQLTASAEAGNRAVMAETDDGAAAAADETRRARRLVERDVQDLRATLDSLRYRDELQLLAGFEGRLKAYQRLEDEILPLAVENTNLKAQRLAFGPSRDAAQSFQAALQQALGKAPADAACEAELGAARATMAVLEIQVTYAPHIAEAQDAAMTQMESQMSAAAKRAREAVARLRRQLPSTAATHLNTAAASLDRFLSIHNEIIALSRRNSDVRSLALSLGEKRKVTAECEAQLQALEDALAKHQFVATR